MRNALIIGATSAIALETAKILASRGFALQLLGRNAARLDAIRADLTTRYGIEVTTLATAFDRTAELEKSLKELLDKQPDIAIMAQGSLGDHAECISDSTKTLNVLETNFIVPALILTTLGNYFETRRGGTLAVIGSVAGDRGRGSNYVYGSAKGALALFVSGLRNRLHKFGVQVLTIKPGFVDTPMTSHLKKGPLFAKPNTVARGIIRAIDRRKDVVYVPGFWRGIMLIIRNIPEFLFKRLSL